MRTAGLIKMGYYPTPPRVVEMIRTFLQFGSEPINVLDPCCGEGLALETLVLGTKSLTYGIELDAARAAEAAKRVKQVVVSAYESVDIPPESFSVLFLNPPYDDQEGERKEFVFLRDLTSTLAVGGILVYVIPRSRLTETVAELLVTHFSDVRIHRFPDPEYGDFNQIVVFGRKSPWPEHRQGRSKELLEKVQAPELSPLVAAPVPVYRPADPRLKGFLRERAHRPEDLVRMSATSPLWHRVRDLIEPLSIKETAQPPTPLHAGHLGLLLAAGRLNGLVGTGPERHIVVGKPVKHIVESKEVEEDDDHGTVEVTRRLETFRVTIKMLTPSGEIRILT